MTCHKAFSAPTNIGISELTETEVATVEGALVEEIGTLATTFYLAGRVLAIESLELFVRPPLGTFAIIQDWRFMLSR